MLLTWLFSRLTCKILEFTFDFFILNVIDKIRYFFNNHCALFSIVILTSKSQIWSHTKCGPSRFKCSFWTSKPTNINKRMIMICHIYLYSILGLISEIIVLGFPIFCSVSFAKISFREQKTEWKQKFKIILTRIFVKMFFQNFQHPFSRNSEIIHQRFTSNTVGIKCLFFQKKRLGQLCF